MQEDQKCINYSERQSKTRRILKIKKLSNHRRIFSKCSVWDKRLGRPVWLVALPELGVSGKAKEKKKSKNKLRRKN